VPGGTDTSPVTSPKPTAPGVGPSGLPTASSFEDGTGSAPPPPVDATSMPAPLPLGNIDTVSTLSPPKLPTDWGGDPARQRPEAILANAASRALNDAWSLPNVKDVAVSMPAVAINSDVHEFPDGQRDALIELGTWSQTRPPMVSTLVTHDDGSQTLQARLDRALPFSGTELELVSQDGKGGWTLSQMIQGSRASESGGDLVVNFDLPAGSPLADPGRTSFIRPKGWNDWMPVRFRPQNIAIGELIKTVPPELQHFSDGKSIVDPMGVSVQSDSSSKVSTQARLQSLTPGDFVGNGVDDAGKVKPYPAEDFHGHLDGKLDDHDGHTDIVTGVGGGNTWVGSSAAPFKMVYTVFDGRNPDLEAKAPDGGVPTGSGLHFIGDPAETILNSLENAAIPVGFVPGPTERVSPPSGAVAYGLADTETVRLLQPGEAFVTPSGNFHTFFIPTRDPVAVQIWVHPRRPPDGTITF
jgi:hypothetical protein